MGWWQINEDDAKEGHYNGDEPADLMGNGITEVMNHFGIPYESETKVPYEDIKSLFFERKFVGFFADKPQGNVSQIISDIWKSLDKIYVKFWKRLPYPEEKQAAFDFTVSGYTPEEQDDQA